MFELLPVEEWPEGWINPPELHRLAECELLDLDPWTICYGDWLVDLHRSIARSYPLRAVVPVAKRGDNDDTACWEVASDRIVVIHIGADPGREVRAEYSNIWAFMRAVFEDFVDRGEDEASFQRSDEGIGPLRGDGVESDSPMHGRRPGAG